MRAGRTFVRAGSPHTGRIATPSRPTAPSDDDAMELALAEARAAAAEGEVPVGAVCLVDGQVVARRHNERERTGDPTAHAELLALRDAAAALGGWRLGDATIVVTLEPCPMCAGATGRRPPRPPRLRGRRPQGGRLRDALQPVRRPSAQPRGAVTGGVRAAECGALLTSFFADRRNDRASGRNLSRRSQRLGSPPGGVRERPNRTVSKTVVPHGHRGFKSHLLRSGPQGPPHGRMRRTQAAGAVSPPCQYLVVPGGRKGANRGTRTFDIRKITARPGQEG